MSSNAQPHCTDFKKIILLKELIIQKFSIYYDYKPKKPSSTKCHIETCHISMGLMQNVIWE